METISIERTKQGHPALWEEGGGFSNTGHATIVAGPNGEKKVPIYIRTRGTLSNDRHALFIVEVGDIVVRADHHREDFEGGIYRVTSFRGDEADLKLVNSFSRGEWDRPESKPRPETVGTAYVHPAECGEAWHAAVRKSTEYHCREPHYAAVKKEE